MDRKVVEMRFFSVGQRSLRSISALRCMMALFFLILVASVIPCQEIGTGNIDNRPSAIQFCEQLRQAVRKKDAKRIAGWINGFPIEVEFVLYVYPLGTAHGTKTILIADEKQFIEEFYTVFNRDLMRTLNSNSGCELRDNPDGTAEIANGNIEIDQMEKGSKTLIMNISPPKGYQDFYKDNGVYENGAKNFYWELQRAILADDRPAVSKLCRYPLSVNSATRHSSINDRGELIARYSEVFTPGVKQAVMAISQPIHQGWRGFMTEHGEVWLDLVVGTSVFRVGTVNVP